MREDTGLVFGSEIGWTLKIDASALNKMRAFIQQRNSDHEAGGVLLGRFIKNATDVVVDEITIPHSSDKSSPTRFYRHQEGHQVFVEKCWRKSEGTCNYLGEWHTHPEDVPHPSGMDLRNWRRLVRETEQEFDGLFFLIVGRKAINAFYVSRRSLKITELHVQK
jgi:integrative and conjugative element protein (TIGR02256 family)